VSAVPLDLVRRAIAERCPTPPATELLSRYAGRRDPEAFAALVRQFGPLVLGVCRRVLGPSADADDAFQSVFLALARQAHTFRDAQALPAWLHRVALRTARKARARRAPHLSEATGGEPAGAADPLAEVAWRDVRRVLDEELDALPEKYRAPVVLCWLDGLTQDEAAGRLGVSLNTLKRRLGEGRAVLRARLARRGLAPVLVGAAATAPDGLRAAVPHTLAEAVARAARGVTGAAPRLPWVTAVATVLAAVTCGVAYFAPAAPPESADTPPAAPVAERPAELPGGPPALPPGAVARFGSTQFRVADGIGAVARSPDGARVAVMTGGGSVIEVYEAATWRRLRTLSADSGDSQFGWFSGQCLAFSPDGRRLAYAKGWRFVYAWDLETGARTQRFEARRPGWDRVCAFTPDGLLALSSAGKLRFFDPVTGAEKRSVAAENVVALSPDGKRFVRNPSLRTPVELVLGDAATGKNLHTFESQAAWWPGVSFAPDGRRLALVPHDRDEIELWDADKPALVKTLTVPAAKGRTWQVIRSGGYTPDGRELCFRLPNGDWARWDATTFRELPPLATGTGPWANEPLPLSDGRTLLTPCVTGWVRLFDRDTGKERPIPGRYYAPAVFALHPGGALVAAADPSGRIDLLDAATGKPVRTLRETGDRVYALAFAPDGATLGVNDGRSTPDLRDYRVAVRALAVADGRELWTRVNDEGQKRPFLALLGVAGNNRVLVEHADDDVRVWDVRTNAEALRLKTPSRSTAVGPGGKVAAYDEYGEVVLFDLVAGREVRRVRVNPEEWERQRRRGFERIAWAADGRTLAVTLPEDTVCILDPETGKERTQFPVYGGKVTSQFKSDHWRDGGHSVESLALSPDGKRLLASALGGGYAALWDVATGQPLARLEAGFEVNAVAFSPDGTSAYTFGRTGLGYRWDVEKLIAARKPKK
jgi:RNA polymerase sigma factor (sigma-70 family)